MYQIDFNGLGNGTSLQRLLQHRCDPGAIRPWAETDRYGYATGRSFITVWARHRSGELALNEKGEPYRVNLVTNAPATMRQVDWLRIDEVVRFAALPALRLWGDVYGTNPVNIPNGYGTIAIQHAVATGQATATISMDPIRKGERSRPTLDTAIIPLPVIHSDGSFTSREVAVTMGSALPLDTTGFTLAARSVSENVEQLILGTASSFTYAGGTIYGVTNFPQRSTKTMTTPTGSNGGTTLTELMDMLATLKSNFFRGPYVAYFSNNWAKWFGLDYTTTYPGSLFSRIQQATPEIVAWRNLDYLTGYQIVIVQMTPDVIEALQGMPITTVQWEEQGGFEFCFKVLCIQVPRVRANAAGKTGIIHGTAP